MGAVVGSDSEEPLALYFTDSMFAPVQPRVESKLIDCEAYGDSDLTVGAHHQAEFALHPRAQ
ncbi:MAG: hypothetical protein ACI95C_000310 [Pseudohongiellaceae bacterium]|jgi:hypothetical protein